MNKPLTTLELRTPNAGWMITAVFIGLCLHGVFWFIFSSLVNLDQPVLQTRQLMISAIFWMICALAMWKLSPPPSRLHAILNVLTCVFFVSFMGTVVAFAQLLFKGAELSAHLLSNYAILSGALLFAQLFLAIPAAIALQQIALRRAPSAP